MLKPLIKWTSSNHKIVLHIVPAVTLFTWLHLTINLSRFIFTTWALNGRSDYRHGVSAV